MSQDERFPNPANSNSDSEAWRAANYPGTKDDTEVEAVVDVEFKPQRGAGPANSRSPPSSRSPADAGFMDIDPEFLSTASPPRLMPAFIARSPWAKQVGEFIVSEGGMSLITATILLCISLAGIVTMFGIAPYRTTGFVQSFSEKLKKVAGGEEELPLLSTLMPNVLLSAQLGLQVTLVPSAVVAAFGIFVLASPRRRRPGCYLVGYGVLAILFGLVMLCLFVRVVYVEQLSGWQAEMTSTLKQWWRATDTDDVRCEREGAFPCSGFDLCCVTNTAPLKENMTEEEAEEMWKSLCFQIFPNGRAFTKDGTDVTDKAEQQCGAALLADVAEQTELQFTTACLFGSGKAASAAKRLTCEDYVVGHITSTMGFSLYLIFGMTVCSLVSGAVALVSNMQRPRTSEFVLVNAPPPAAVAESTMPPKSQNAADGRGTARKKY